MLYPIFKIKTMNPLKKAMVAITLCVGSLHAQETVTQDSLSLATRYLDEVVVLDSRLPLKRSQSGKTIVRIDQSRLNDSTGEIFPNYSTPKREYPFWGIAPLRGKICGWLFVVATTTKF